MLPLFDNVPTRRFALVTVGLVAANIGIWLWELRAGDVAVADRYGFYPCALEGPCVGIAREHLPWAESVLAGMFIHAGWLHVLGNMLFLWIFGNNVEDVMGRLRFLLFYLAAGFAAALAQAWMTLHAAGPSAASIPNVGASGAIAGVLGAYVVLLPRARVITLLFGFLPVPISALVFIGLWFLFQLWQGGASLTQPQAGGGVAFFAHVGGFVFGLLTVRLWAVRPPLRPGRR